jgi:hypothetical protein
MKTRFLILILLACSMQLSAQSEKQFLHSVVDSLVRNMSLHEYESFTYGTEFSLLSNGLSAWKAKSNGVGRSGTYRLIYGNVPNHLAAGISFSWSKHFDNYNEVNMSERERLIYAAPQFYYISRRHNRDRFYAMIGGGLGYLSYKSKSALPEDRVTEVKDSSLGLNALVNLNYRITKHLGLCLDVNALYSHLKPDYQIYKYSPLEAREKFNILQLSTRLGIVWDTKIRH